MADIPPITPGEINLNALPALLQTNDPKIFEIGCHNGFHTNHFLSLFPKGRVYAFEPDKRAQDAFRRHVTDARAVLFHVAIGACDGTADFYVSHGDNPNVPRQSDWDYSGSIRKPTGHLREHPWCSFTASTAVRVRALDTVVEELGLERIDFIWADVQGAEIDIIQGGKVALARTRFLYTEYSDEELYQGQANLPTLMAHLPDFRVIVRWQNDVLLWNTAFEPPHPGLIPTDVRQPGAHP